jgi:hypothetical protein
MTRVRASLHGAVFLCLPYLLQPGLTLGSPQQTHFVAHRLRVSLQSQRKILESDNRAEKDIPADELIKSGQCFRVKLVHFVDKNHRLGTLFDHRNPIVLATSTRQHVMDATVSDVLVDFEKDFPSKSKLLDDVPIYGPALANEIVPLHIELKISNLPVGPDQQSFFDQALEIARRQVRETRAFYPFLNNVASRISALYNNNLKVSLDLDWVEQNATKNLYRGYWAIVPNEEPLDRRFISKLSAGEYSLTEFGDPIDKNGKEIEPHQLPHFLLIRIEDLAFDPINWRAELGNTIQVIGPRASTEPSVTTYLRTAAADAMPAAEEYLFERLMKRRFDLVRARPEPTTEGQDRTDLDARKKAVRDFLTGFVSAGFESEKAKSQFLSFLPNWLNIDGSDEFPETIRRDALALARVLNTRWTQGDIEVSGARCKLVPVTSTGGRFEAIPMPKEGTSGDPIHAFIKTYLRFLEAGEVYLDSEWAEMRSTLLNRFDIQGADAKWPLALFRDRLRTWESGTDTLLVKSGKVRVLTGAQALLWRTEQRVSRLPADRLVSASSNSEVRELLQELADFLVSEASDKNQRDLVEASLRGYTGYEERDLARESWGQWLADRRHNIWYDASEFPPFFERTPLRDMLIRTKERHATYKSRHMVTTGVVFRSGDADKVLGPLVRDFIRKPDKNPADKKAVPMWLQSTTAALPNLEPKNTTALDGWLRTAIYNFPLDRWVLPRDARTAAVTAFDSLQRDIAGRQVTPESLTWAAETFAFAGDSLPPEMRTRFAHDLTDASDISEKEQFSNEDKTQPSVWGRFLRIFRIFRFFEVSDSPNGQKAKSLPFSASKPT